MIIPSTKVLGYFQNGIRFRCYSWLKLLRAPTNRFVRMISCLCGQLSFPCADKSFRATVFRFPQANFSSVRRIFPSVRVFFRFVRTFSASCAGFCVCAGAFSFRAAILFIRALIFPFVRPFSDLCGQKLEFLTVLEVEEAKNGLKIAIKGQQTCSPCLNNDSRTIHKDLIFMKQKIVSLTAAFKTTDAFGIKYATDFPPASMGGQQFALIHAAVPQTADLGAAQVSGSSSAHAEVFVQSRLPVSSARRFASHHRRRALRRVARHGGIGRQISPAAQRRRPGLAQCRARLSKRCARIFRDIDWPRPRPEFHHPPRRGHRGF
jgi:hypothetical protein